ncbi:7948_t:CDS:2, partial [Entrophospora sp. SA101]
MNNNDELTSLQTNNHLRRKIGRPRKPIWQHFTEIGSTNNNNNNKQPGAKCNYCGQQWARGKSSDMISHIALSCTKPPPPDIRIKFQNKKTITNEKQLRCSYALTKFFVCCGIPFWVVENPFFVDFITNLCPGFHLPKRTTLSTTFVNLECLDGWTSPAGQSLYIFVIMTSDRKEYVHSLKKFSKDSHTGNFLCTEISRVLNEVDEIKSAYQELNETEFEQVVIQSNLHFSELINVDDEELQNVLGIEVSVVIPPYEIIEHGDPEFDVESIVDNLMTRRSKGSNQNVNVTNE